VIVFVSAVVEASVPVATPCAFVVDAGCTTVLFLPVARKLTVCPAMGLPPESLTVTVIVTVALPFAVTVLAPVVKSDLLALGRSGTSASNVENELTCTVTIPDEAFTDVGTSVVTPVASSLSTTTLVIRLPAGTATGIVKLTGAANVVPAGPQVTAGPAARKPPWLTAVPAWRLMAVALLRAPAGMVSCAPVIVPVPETAPPLEPMNDGDGGVVGVVGVEPLPHETATDPTTNASVRR
jgi:hypothetical protein